MLFDRLLWYWEFEGLRSGGTGRERWVSHEAPELGKGM